MVNYQNNTDKRLTRYEINLFVIMIFILVFVVFPTLIFVDSKVQQWANDQGFNIIICGLIAGGETALFLGVWARTLISLMPK